MKYFGRILTTSAVLATVWVSSAWATGSLAITAVGKSGSMLVVSGTCMQGAGPVKVWLKDVSTGAQIKVYTAPGSCGATAATTGRSVKFSVATVPAGTYDVYLRQAGQTAGPGGTVVLP